MGCGEGINAAGGAVPRKIKLPPRRKYNKTKMKINLIFFSEKKEINSRQNYFFLKMKST